MRLATLLAAALALLSADLAAKTLERRDGLLRYTCSIDRRSAEPAKDLLSDGDDSTGVRWHTKFKATTGIVCELSESREIDMVEIHIPKWNKWHIVDEIRISVDDGTGGFGDPLVMPGLERSPAGQKELRDATCTNHVFSARNLGRAVRIGFTLVSDAAAAVNEIRIFAKPRTAADRPAAFVPAASPEPVRRLEGRYWSLGFSPVGGRAVNLFSKAAGVEMTNPGDAGSFSEEVWDRRASRGFLMRKPYSMSYSEAASGAVSATAEVNAQGGGIDFLRVFKRYVAADDTTALKVEYRFENIPEAMALQNYGILVRAALGVLGRDVTCYYPVADGIAAMRPGERGEEYWVHHPARGWMAAAADDGTGVAVTMPYREVKAFYSRFSQVPTFEWRLIPAGLDAGASFEVAMEIIPFKGLKTVSGAGGGVVGSLAGGRCSVVSGRAGEISAEAGGRTVAMRFAAPGDMASFDTTESTVVLKRDGREICSLFAAPAKGAWRIEKESAQRGATVQGADLTRYTNFTHSACRPWGRPLAGRRLRLSVLTGSGNQIEIGRLADRFDFDFSTVGVMLAPGYGRTRKLGNPVFADGDNFSLVDTSDMERGIAAVLGRDPDVILAGGVPFEALSPDLRKQLVARVRAGAGLVWIGQDRDVPDLGFKLAAPSAELRLPSAKGPLLSSVPFSLLGREPVYGIAVPDGAKVHAACSDRPYVVETSLGRGRVFNVAYRALSAPPRPSAGLTPAGLRDFYETREAPVEHYYSLLAKIILAAAGRSLPVGFGDVTVASGAARVELTSGCSGEAVFEWRVLDPFGRCVASGERKVLLSSGPQEVPLQGLGIPPAQGPLAFELVVRDSAGMVLNWGAWAFSNEPKGVIAGLDLDGRWRREGETAGFDVKLAGDLAGMSLAVSLVDSYGRTVAERSYAAAGRVKGAFCISNALPARCYSVEARLSGADGMPVSRRRAELRVRPCEERYAWMDFEIGTWANGANREYLWPGLAGIYRLMDISTIIANPERIQKDFAMRYNFHPTLLADAGLHRSPEPEAYAKTGDKMTLVRPTCLSSPEFFAKRAKSLDAQVRELARYGMRFVWFGDEQSITGYGGSAVDFCFSKPCLEEMRRFARARYGTLERLNEEWESDFSSWDDVVPFTRQEVWSSGGRHAAGWADHLEFMDSRLTNSVAFSVRRMHAADPAVRFALSGTQAPSAYGGMDWWKQLGVMDAGLTYDGGGQHDIHRSFRPDGGFMPWKWGYSRRGPAAVDGVWLAAFVQSRGIMGFQSSSQINSDWTFSAGLRDSMPHIHRLASGTGLHFINNLVSGRDVAILYSQASLRAAFIEKRREMHDLLEEKYRVLLRSLGCPYDYISYEQLERGVAVERGYRVLLLVDALAMSDAEIAAVLAFAEKGGTVVADGMPATRHANCRMRGSSPLAGLFRSSRHRLYSEMDVSYLKAVEFPDRPENAVTVATWRNGLAEVLSRSGVSTGMPAVMDADSGAAVVNASIYPYSDRAGNPLWCVISPKADKMRSVRFVFPRKAWTCDLVSGRAYGVVSELQLPLGRGTPYAFAQFPGEIRLFKPAVDGARVSVAYDVPVDGAVHISVFRPDGTEARCYAKNLLVKGGRAVYEVPFALSDPCGTWTVRAESIFGGACASQVLFRTVRQ